MGDNPNNPADSGDSPHPRVFVSYAWEGDSHRAWVRRLAEDLVASGVEVRLDQWHVKTGESFTQFMETEVAAADFVIIVCTPQYARKSNSRTGGVGYEQQIISGELVLGVPRYRFLPVVRKGTFEHGTDHAIPTHFIGIAAIDFRDDTTYAEKLEELLRAIYSEPLFQPPELGLKPPLPISSRTETAPSALHTGTQVVKRKPRAEHASVSQDRPTWRGAKVVVSVVAILATIVAVLYIVRTSDNASLGPAEAPPFIVPETPSSDRVIIRHEFDNPTYEPFNLLTDRKVVDFRLWKRLSAEERAMRLSPVTWTRIVSARKTAMADTIRFQYSTTGLGIDFRCRDIKCLIEERAPEPTGDKTRIQKTYHVVADVSDIAVGEKFSVVIEATYWNAFQGDENAFVTMRSHAPLELMSLTLVFPLINGSPAASPLKPQVGPYGRGELREWEDGDGVYLVDSTGSQIYWEVPRPTVSDVYIQRWQWEGI